MQAAHGAERSAQHGAGREEVLLQEALQVPGGKGATRPPTHQGAPEGSREHPQRRL